MNPKTFQEYLVSALARGQIDHQLRVVQGGDNGAEFYIHPAQGDGETPQFIARGNVLTDPRLADAGGDLVLVRFHWEIKRMGDVDGMFVVEKAHLEASYGKHVEFGEILGKHSEICGPLDRDDITVVSEDQTFLRQLVAIMGCDLGGYNPLEYMQ